MAGARIFICHTFSSFNKWEVASLPKAAGQPLLMQPNPAIMMPKFSAQA
jgi:hypothetical protein